MVLHDFHFRFFIFDIVWGQTCFAQDRIEERNTISKEVAMIRRLFIPCILLLSIAALAGAQEITGSIVGVVKDSSGGVIPGATITITDLNKKTVIRTLVADATGSFSVPLLSVGKYQVVVEVSRFQEICSGRYRAGGESAVFHQCCS